MTPAGPIVLWPILLIFLWALVVGVTWSLLTAHGRRSKEER